jgi:hypothetical protein
MKKIVLGLGVLALVSGPVEQVQAIDSLYGLKNSRFSKP